MFKNKLFVVVGFGITGLSVIKFLHKKKYKVIALDTRINPPNIDILQTEYKDITIHYGKNLNEYQHYLNSADHIVLSPGIALSTPAITIASNNGVNVIGDIELFAQFVDNKKIVCVTGSNGKSTVTSLLGEVVKYSGINVGVGGNIGRPALDLLYENYDLYILELSSYQLELIKSLKACCGTLLNISPDHLDRYKDYESYIATKCLLYKFADFVVYNSQDQNTYPPNCINFAASNCDSFFYGPPRSDKDFGVKEDENNVLAIFQGNNKLITVNELKIIGHHNIENILAVLTIARKLNLPLNNSLNAIKSFIGLAHRCEVVGRFKQVLWINDSKGTNVGATIKAINGLSEQIIGNWVIVLGGDNTKGQELINLLEPVQKKCKALIVIGDAKEELKSIFKNNIDLYEAIDLESLVSIADKITLPGDGVLFSPSCASFDMFANFSQRGELFKKAVLAYYNS